MRFHRWSTCFTWVEKEVLFVFYSLLFILADMLL